MRRMRNTLGTPAGALRRLFARRNEPPAEPEPAAALDTLAGALDGYLFGATVRPHEKAGVLHIELEGLPAWIMVPSPRPPAREANEAEHSPEDVAA